MSNLAVRPDRVGIVVTPTRRSSVVHTALVGLCALTTPVLAVDDAADRAKRLERWLREPATPAIEVLLLESAGDPRVDEHWRASLSHADQKLRAAAARAIRASGRVALAPGVATALERETDPLAASELAEAIIELTADVTPLVMSAVRKMPQPVAVHVLQAMARRAPLAMPVQLVAILDLGLPGVERVAGEALASHVSRGTVHGTATRQAIVDRGTVEGWRFIGDVQARSGQLLPMGLLARALRSGTSGVAEQALADYLDQALSPTGDRAALARNRAAFDALVPATAPDPRRFAREIVARSSGDAPAMDLGALGTVAIPRSSPLVRLRGSAQDLLRPEERTALDAAWGEQDFAESALGITSMTLPRDLPEGVWTGLEGWGACPRIRGVLTAEVTYNAVGRVSNIRLPNGISDGCQRLIATISRISSSIGPGEMRIAIPLGASLPPRFGTRVSMLPLQPPRQGESRRDFVSPVLKKSVKPEYPRDSLDARAEGRVWLDVLIDETGWVREAGVIRSAETRLDAQALLTMLEWRFEPARLTGQPVACRVVVEMEFSLGK